MEQMKEMKILTIDGQDYEVVDETAREEIANLKKTGGGTSSGSGGITSETDPTVPEWAKQPEKPTYTADEIGAQPKGNYALQSDVNKLSEDVEALKSAGGSSVSFTVDTEGNATIQ